MTAIARKTERYVPLRVYQRNTYARDFTVSPLPRDFASNSPNRNFGVEIVGWRIWGQTDIHPFETGGVDSTKPFGDLP